MKRAKELILILILAFSLLLPISPSTEEVDWLIGWAYRKSIQIQGSTAGNLSDYQMKIIVHFNGSVRGAGNGITRNDFLVFDGSNVTLKHDFFDVNAPSYEIVTPPGEGAGYWTGAGSILKDGNTWYITYRNRNPTNRGYEIVCRYNTGDITNSLDWLLLWDVKETEVTNTPSTIESFEQSCLRKFGNYFYLYFCAIMTSGDWKVYYVNATSVSGLEAQLLDYNNWNLAIQSNDPDYPEAKDPQVYEVSGKYYMKVSFGNVAGNDGYMNWYKADSPAGPWTLICKLNDIYQGSFAPNKQRQFLVITYDNSSGYYILMSKAKNDTSGEFYWWFAKSVDLENWEYITEYKIVGANGGFRYFDFYAVDDQRMVFVGAYDHDGDSDQSMVLWDYRSDATGSTVTAVQRDINEHVFLSGKCRSDFGDVRFTTSDGLTELSYWIENYTIGDSATFWVKVPSIPTSGTSIYIYYGNPDATTTSNGANTFLIFDDFNDGNISDWTKTQISGYATYGDFQPTSTTKYEGSYGAIFDAKANGASEQVLRKAISEQNISITVWIRDSFDPAYAYGIGVIVNFQDSNNFLRAIIGSGTFLLHKKIGGTGTTLVTGTPKSKNAWLKLTVYRLSTGLFKASLENETLKTTVTDITSGDIGLFGRGGTAQAGDGFWDLFFVRKYVEPEPAHGSWGSEEEPPPPQPSNIGASNNQPRQNCVFYAYWAASTGNLSHALFYWNVSGTMTLNGTMQISGVTAAWSNFSRTLPDQPGMIIAWYITCNDTDGRWGNTSVQILVLSCSYNVVVNEQLGFEGGGTESRWLKFSLKTKISDTTFFDVSVFKGVLKVFNENLYIVEAYEKNLFKSLSESFTVFSSTLKTITSLFSENLALQDKHKKSIHITMLQRFKPLEFTQKSLAVKITESITFSDKQFTSVFIIIKEQIIQDFINIRDEVTKHLTILKAEQIALPETSTKQIRIFKTESLNFLDQITKRIGPFFYIKIIPEQASFTDVVVTFKWTPWYNDPAEFMKVVLFGFCMGLFAYWIAKRL